MLLGVLRQYLDLMGNAVAVALVVVIAGKADIEGYPLFDR